MHVNSLKCLKPFKNDTQKEKISLQVCTGANMFSSKFEVTCSSVSTILFFWKSSIEYPWRSGALYIWLSAPKPHIAKKTVCSDLAQILFNFCQAVPRAASKIVAKVVKKFRKTILKLKLAIFSRKSIIKFSTKFKDHEDIVRMLGLCSISRINTTIHLKCVHKFL